LPRCQLPDELRLVAVISMVGIAETGIEPADRCNVRKGCRVGAWRVVQLARPIQLRQQMRRRKDRHAFPHEGVVAAEDASIGGEEDMAAGFER
jgi:alkylated DNA nucleotide flippase Atl1